ncbi:hypothetical protein B0H14DRAFT_2679306 [Mycena olivaceomarginata]|nr:hypothetical protein B0H14DRAFT_2679306 [Mycena olivaceomarginata]
MNSARALWSSILRFICKRDSEVLKDLERDRSLAQRQLNAVTDPVARLPLELSSKIFIHSLPLLPVPAAINAPLLLLNICSAWRNIALSTPALWDAIHISAWTEGSKELVPSWLECAGDRPLSIAFNGIGTEIDYDVLSVIWERGEQLKNLDIFDYQDGIQLWKGAGPGPLPKLETLHIVGGAGDAWGLPSLHISELLCLAPNLIECLFEYLPLSFSVPASQRIILPNLRRLLFGGDGALPGSANEVLDSLSLPGLKVLVADVRCDILLPFLKRSSPPLQELVFVERLFAPYDFLWLDECLQLVPDLRQLKIWMANVMWLKHCLWHWPNAHPCSRSSVVWTSTSMRGNLYFPGPFGRRHSVCSQLAAPSSSWSTLIYLIGCCLRRSFHRTPSLHSRDWRQMG